MSDTTSELKIGMVTIIRDQRDKPARSLLVAGATTGIVGIIGAAVVAALALDDPGVAYDHREMIGAVLSIGVVLLGGVLYAAGSKMRDDRVGRENLIEEIRDARPADTVEIGRLVAEHEATQTLLRQLREQMDRTTATVPRLIAEAVAQARAEDRAEQEEAVKRARADAYVDMLNGDRTVSRMFPVNKRHDPTS